MPKYITNLNCHFATVNNHVASGLWKLRCSFEKSIQPTWKISCKKLRKAQDDKRPAPGSGEILLKNEALKKKQGIISLFWVPAKFQVRLSTKGNNPDQSRSIWSAAGTRSQNQSLFRHSMPGRFDERETSSRQREGEGMFLDSGWKSIVQLAQLQKKL